MADNGPFRYRRLACRCKVGRDRSAINRNRPTFYCTGTMKEQQHVKQEDGRVRGSREGLAVVENLPFHLGANSRAPRVAAIIIGYTTGTMIRPTAPSSGLFFATTSIGSLIDSESFQINLTQ